MIDPLRSDRDAAAADLSERDRDARIEELLVVGLDHYFAEQYEQAINVWTRVLFIDRGHARARAYIERARSAAAERLRKGDELLHTGVAAFDRGDADAARQLLASAVEHGAAHDEALAVLGRIERLEVAGAIPLAEGEGAPRSAAPRESTSRPRARARIKWIGAGVAAGIILGAALLTTAVQRGFVRWPGSATDTRSAAALTPTVPVPSIAELALTRAQNLYGRGRVYEALAVLEQIPAGDPTRARADALLTTIQKQLLAATRGESSADGAGRQR